MSGVERDRLWPRSRVWLFLTLATAGCLIDLATKSWIFNQLGLPPSPTWWLVEDIFGFQTSLNPGALFGMGAGFTWLFAVLSVLAAAGIVAWLFAYGAARDGLLTFALGLITGGILGNLYDRLGLWCRGMPHVVQRHAVRDWILFQYRDFTWPNFNIADSLLVCGTAILFFHALTQPAESERSIQGVEGKNPAT